MDVLVFIGDYLVDQEEGIKSLIAGFLNQVMLAEALQQARAAQYERTDARKAHRNGYKERSLKTRYGDPILRKPQFREVPFETQVFGRYAQVEKLRSMLLSSRISRASQRGESRRSSVIWASILSPRLRSLGSPGNSVIRCRPSSCGRLNRQSLNSSWVPRTTR